MVQRIQTRKDAAKCICEQARSVNDASLWSSYYLLLYSFASYSVVISAQGNGVGPNLKQNLSRTPSHLSRTILGLIHVMRSHPPDKCHAINFFTTLLGTNLDLLGCYKTRRSALFDMWVIILRRKNTSLSHYS
ncbi:hypothetical protein J6590_047073 [Homalodisca vitripennis]|nr:hypothetical protein J6590_047073 [Homalodisca vitripennis]